MKLPKNNYTTSNKEVEMILTDVANQIKDKNSNATFGSNVVARIMSYADYDRIPSAVNTINRYYHKDAIRLAIATIKEMGWYVWGHTNYENALTIWVTKAPEKPHIWFSRM